MCDGSSSDGFPSVEVHSAVGGEFLFVACVFDHDCLHPFWEQIDDVGDGLAGVFGVRVSGAKNEDALVFVEKALPEAVEECEGGE